MNIKIETWDQADGKGIDDLLASGHVPVIRPPEDVLPAIEQAAEAQRAGKEDVVLYPLTDAGNAERLEARHGPDVRCADGAWHVWNGRVWLRDEKGAAVRDRTLETMRATIPREMRIALQGADEDEAEDLQKTYLRFARSSESVPKMEATEKQAGKLRSIRCSHEAFDANPWLLNVLNGTIDLRTGDLLPHRREDQITKLAPVEFDPGATCPRWHAFLERCMARDQAKIGYLQRCAGYTLTGLTVEEVFFLLYGTGRNGKGTTVETLAALLGPDYARKLPTELLLEQKFSAGNGPTPDIARLKGARFAHATESNETRRLNEAFIKEMTGGDTLTGRFMRENPFDFRPSHKLWFQTNHKPEIRGCDDGIWSRIHFIPFTVTISEEEKDKGLKAALLVELPGILNWVLAGCLAWQRQGLNRPAEVLAATSEYRIESDVFGQFLDACCVIRSTAKTPASDLLKAYNAWAAEAGERSLSARGLGAKLRDRGFTSQKSHGVAIWHGVGLLARGQDGEDEPHGEDVSVLSPKAEKVKTGFYMNAHGGESTENPPHTGYPPRSTPGGLIHDLPDDPLEVGFL